MQLSTWKQRQYQLICTCIRCHIPRLMVHKELRIDAFHWVWLSRNEGDLYSFEMVYELARMLALLTRPLYLF